MSLASLQVSGGDTAGDILTDTARGPLIWGPVSEAYGRKGPLFFGMAVFSVFQIPVAVAQNIETIFVCRFLQATFGVAPIGILGGCYVHFLQQIELGIAISIFAAVVFAGPAVGPIAGSFITESSLGGGGLLGSRSSSPWFSLRWHGLQRRRRLRPFCCRARPRSFATAPKTGRYMRNAKSGHWIFVSW